MKKILTFLLLLTIVTVSFAQVTRQKVILEVGTGTWCGACPTVVAIIHNLEAADANIAVVEYHGGSGDNYVNTAGNVRADYYNFSWFPTTYYDSNHIGYDDWGTYSVHYSYYEERNNTPSSFSLDFSGEYNSSTRIISGQINLTKVAEYSGTNLVLHIVITESNIPENWQGETELDYVERLMFPSANGTAINFSENTTQEVLFNFGLDTDWSDENCNLVYFIQDNDTKEILQGDEIKLSDVSVAALDRYTNNSNLSIYPNPVIDIMKIKSNADNIVRDISIYDTKGLKVHHQDIYTGGISLKHLQEGVYLLSYYENDSLVKTKLIVQ